MEAGELFRVLLDTNRQKTQAILYIDDDDSNTTTHTDEGKKIALSTNTSYRQNDQNKNDPIHILEENVRNMTLSEKETNGPILCNNGNDDMTSNKEQEEKMVVTLDVDEKYADGKNNSHEANILEKGIGKITLSDKETNDQNNDTPKFTRQDLIIPTHLEIGRAVADGNCFFDCFRQGLEQFLNITVTISDLRSKCKEFAENNPPAWFITAIGNSHDNSGVRTETTLEYIGNIQNSNRWGDPDIEGIILCKSYNVSFYVLEKQLVAGQELYTTQLINEHGSSSACVDFYRHNTFFMINEGRRHFDPIIRKVPGNYVQEINKFNDNRFYVNQSIANLNKTFQHHESIDQLSDVTRYLVIKAFNKLESVIKMGDIKNLNKLIYFLYQTAEKTSLVQIYKDKRNVIRNTHLIVLTCKYSQPLVLEYLLHKSNILCYLPCYDSSMENIYIQAFCETMRSCNIQMLEMLYDYWCGDVHWHSSNRNNESNADDIVNNLKQVNKCLITARNRSQKFLKLDQQMLVDVHCIIQFNLFQLELYTELNKLKPQHVQDNNDSEKTKNEVKYTIAILLTAFRIYEKFSGKNIRLTKHLEPDKNKLEKLLKEDSIYMKIMIYCMYEKYHRKLDYNIALLVINNIHFLKLRLTMPFDTYQEVESALYYFLYRVSEGWKLYVPEIEQKSEDIFPFIDDDGNLDFTKIRGVQGKLLSGPVIYLEWQKYTKSIRKFRQTIQNVDIASNLRAKGTKLPKEEINNLSLLPYLRDDYSLKKIMQYIRQIDYVTFNTDKMNNILLIQRVIQVTGEFLKGTDDSCHLSPTTLALLQVEIPKDAFKNLLDLRDYFSHARDGKLIRRIDLELNIDVVFMEVFKDLDEIKKAIHTVTMIYKPLLEKYLVKSGIHLLSYRLNELPEEATIYYSSIEVMFEINYMYNEFDTIEMENKIMKMSGKKFSRQLIREIGLISKNLRTLRGLSDEREREIIIILIENLHKYTNSILQTIANIKNQLDVWESIQSDLKKIQFPLLNTIMAHPNKESIGIIKNELKCNKTYKKIRNEILQKLKAMEDWDREFLQIKRLLTFIVEEVDYFSTHHWQIKRSEFSNLCKTIEKGFPDKTGIENVKLLIGHITAHSEYYRNIAKVKISTNEKLYEYRGLQNMIDKMRKTFFITKNEMEYLKNFTNNICDCSTKNSCKHRDLIEKIYNNTVLNEKEYEFIKPKITDKKFQKIIMNLVNGNKRDSNMLECLVNRTKLLNVLLAGHKKLDKLILRYKHDANFRFAIEIVISDIMNIYMEGWLQELANTNYTKLLTEYPLRNILEHGNPLLDICGSTLDANDLPASLITFALKAGNDEAYLIDLFKLYEDGVNRAEVKTDSSENFNDEQRNLIKKFKECSRWRSYVKFLPVN